MLILQWIVQLKVSIQVDFYKLALVLKNLQKLDVPATSPRLVVMVNDLHPNSLMWAAAARCRDTSSRTLPLWIQWAQTQTPPDRARWTQMPGARPSTSGHDVGSGDVLAGFPERVRLPPEGVQLGRGDVCEQGTGSEPEPGHLTVI